MDYPLSALEGVPGVLVPQHSVGSNPEPTNSIRFTSNTHAGIRLADAAVNNFGGLKNAMEPVSFLRDNANMLTFYIHVRICPYCQRPIYRLRDVTVARVSSVDAHSPLEPSGAGRVSADALVEGRCYRRPDPAPVLPGASAPDFSLGMRLTETL